MKLTSLAIVLIGTLSSCVTMGNARMELTLLDKRTHAPLPGASVLAYYQTVVFGPVALPGRLKTITNSQGVAEFKHLANGHWFVRADIPGRESQQACFSIEDARFNPGPRGDEKLQTQTGRVAGNPCKDPDRPALFLGKLLRP